MSGPLGGIASLAGTGAQAEVLQKWAEAVLAVCASLPDEQLSIAAEQQANSIAQSLFKQSVEAYQQVSCNAGVKTWRRSL